MKIISLILSFQLAVLTPIFPNETLAQGGPFDPRADIDVSENYQKTSYNDPNKSFGLDNDVVMYLAIIFWIIVGASSVIEFFRRIKK